MSRASSGASTETSEDVVVISAGPVGQSVADRMTRGRARRSTAVQ
jgi:choline dehydrogenase-like flavoprotein